jgi:hypothetical protein
VSLALAQVPQYFAVGLKKSPKREGDKFVSLASGAQVLRATVCFVPRALEQTALL